MPGRGPLQSPLGGAEPPYHLLAQHDYITGIITGAELRVALCHPDKELHLKNSSSSKNTRKIKIQNEISFSAFPLSSRHSFQLVFATLPSKVI